MLGSWVDIDYRRLLVTNELPPSGQDQDCTFKKTTAVSKMETLTESGISTCNYLCSKAPLTGKHKLIHKFMLEKVQFGFIIIYNLNGECVLLKMLIIITKQSVYSIFLQIVRESGIWSVSRWRRTRPWCRVVLRAAAPPAGNYYSIPGQTQRNNLFLLDSSENNNTKSEAAHKALNE